MNTSHTLNPLSDKHDVYYRDTDDANQWCAPPVEQLVQESGKLVFLVQLLQQLKNEGHQTLLFKQCLVTFVLQLHFSQSIKMLDIIEKVLNDKVCPKFNSLKLTEC